MKEHQLAIEIVTNFASKSRALKGEEFVKACGLISAAFAEMQQEETLRMDEERRYRPLPLKQETEHPQTSMPSKTV